VQQLTEYSQVDSRQKNNDDLSVVVVVIWNEAGFKEAKDNNVRNFITPLEADNFLSRQGSNVHKRGPGIFTTNMMDWIIHVHKFYHEYKWMKRRDASHPTHLIMDHLYIFCPLKRNGVTYYDNVIFFNA
jgi:hypothetical protein